MHKKIEPEMETSLFSGLQVWGLGLRFFWCSGFEILQFGFLKGLWVAALNLKSLGLYKSQS